MDEDDFYDNFEETVNFDESNFEETESDDDYDYCYECEGYGDDYYVDEKGELVSRCIDCPFNHNYDN